MSSKLLVPALALLGRPILALDEQYFLLASNMSPDSRLVFFESFYHFKYIFIDFSFLLICKPMCMYMEQYMQSMSEVVYSELEALYSFKEIHI